MPRCETTTGQSPKVCFVVSSKYLAMSCGANVFSGSFEFGDSMIAVSGADGRASVNLCWRTEGVGIIGVGGFRMVNKSWIAISWRPSSIQAMK